MGNCSNQQRLHFAVSFPATANEPDWLDPVAIVMKGKKIAAAFAWVESPTAVNMAIKILAGLCVLLFLLDFIIHRHTYAPGEGMWGFYAFTGFIAFTLIVLGAKLLRSWILRDENYYGAQSIDSEEYPVSQLEIKSHPRQNELDVDQENDQ